MGDRTSVTLTFLSVHREKVMALPNFDVCNEDTVEDWCTSYQYDEVNYGNLTFLNELRDAGIAYDSSWENGDGYSSGTQSCRFTPEGVCIEKELYDTSINPSMDALMERIDSPNKLRGYILEHHEMFKVLPLDPEQEAYGKLYLTHKLIGSTPITKED